MLQKNTPTGSSDPAWLTTLFPNLSQHCDGCPDGACKPGAQGTAPRIVIIFLESRDDILF